METFNDLLPMDDFIIDDNDLENVNGENWDTGIPNDIFASGDTQDIFTTKD